MDKGNLDYDEWIAEEQASDPEFRAARAQSRPMVSFRIDLIKARLAAGLTQKQLAERMGTKQAAVARLENGNQMPSVDTLYRLAQVLGVEFTITPEEKISVRPHEAA